MQNTKIKELETKINQARKDYYNDPLNLKTSDRLFDTWIAELTKLDPDNSAITDIGAPLAPSVWEKAKHHIPMGSLEKVNTPEELKKWYENTCPGEELFFSEKLDGLSVELVYEKGKLIEASTRGDGVIGENIFANVYKMGGVQKALKDSTFTGSMRGEIILTKTNHQKHFADMPNPRNGAVGISKRLDGTGSQYLDVLLYQVLGDEKFETENDQFKFLKKLGCKTPNFQVLKTPELVIKKWTEYQAAEFRDNLDYDIDGIVVRINDLVKQEKLGSTNLRPKGARAFKFENEAAETTLIDCEFQCGNTGRITPVAILEPTFLCGATIERASLYNMAYINELGIGVGAKVLLVRANDVIPRVEEVIEAPEKVIKAPKKCPSCQGDIEVDGEYLVCRNTEECPAQVMGAILNWKKDLKILELGDTLIEKLVSSGLVQTVADLYLLTVPQLETLDRMGEKSAENVINSLWKTNEITLDIFLGALSIPLIGSSSIRLLMDAGYKTLKQIMKMDQEEMENIKGMGPSRSQSLFEGLQKKAGLIEELLDNGVSIKQKEEKMEGKLTGKSFVLTGTMEHKRDELVEMIEDAGGSVQGSVSKTTTFLVIADPESTSTKAKKARSLKIGLISEEQLLKMIG